MEIYSLTDLEANSPHKSQWGHACSETLGSLPLPLPTFWWSQWILGVPWLWMQRHHCRAYLSHLLPVCLCLYVRFSFSENTNHIRAHIDDLFLICLHPQRPCCQVRFHSQVHELRLQYTFSEGNAIQPITLLEPPEKNPSTSNTLHLAQ